MRFHAPIFCALCFFLTCHAARGWALNQPLGPQHGFGSNEFDLCPSSCAQPIVLDGESSADRVTYWLPQILKDGDSAPVLVYLHGFLAMAPQNYQSHIDHLTRQGYIVIFPQFQPSGIEVMNELGVIRRTDQGNWLGRAIRGTERVLNILGPRANRQAIYGFGHSIGGLLLTGWDKSGGPPLKAVVLANPKLDLDRGMPSIVRRMVRIKELPWRQMIDGVKGRIVILGGEDDTIATPTDMAELRRYASNAERVSLYIASSDKHSNETMHADHFSPMTGRGPTQYLNWVLDSMGGRAALDTYDFRYYHAAVDSMLSGDDFVPDMGRWSDGFPFAAVKREY